MIAWNQESLIPLTKAPLPGHAATKWRWALRGVRGVRLESVVIGGQRFTTADACTRFIAKLNGEAVVEPRQDVTDRADAAGRELRAMGA